MALRFSDDGPEFPSALVNAILSGEVVFLCGAGISAPQLPGFGQLVAKTYKALNLEVEPSETSSLAAGRYEEVLGALSRRLAEPGLMIRTVSGLLAPPENPDLENHEIVLRLSRDLNNQPVIVTTNFDTLIERAWINGGGAADIRQQSFAGQAIPAPGNSSFKGVVHLHGRLDDVELGLEQTPLVLTSADYGEAYMRSGWASRFLFDLVRCKTVLLIGYSASDAPVRYFLNVLEADRERFPDLNRVYALYGVENDVSEADAQWETLAVRPLAYTYKKDQQTGAQDHTALWRDLAELANLVERPKESRQNRARAILTKSVDAISEIEINEIVWLLKGRVDLWNVVIETITDVEWFSFFTKQHLWSEEDATWVIPSWVSRNFQDRDRFRLAVEWNQRLGQNYRSQLARHLSRVTNLPEYWNRVWRLLTTSSPREFGWHRWESNAYSTLQVLNGPVVLDKDLRNAVSLLSPTLELEPNRSDSYGGEIADRATCVGDIIWSRLKVEEPGGLPELIAKLTNLPDHSERLMALATAELWSAIGSAIDAGLTQGERDAVDASVPSVEDHEQNEYREGVIFLVRLLADLLPKLAASDPDAVRRFAQNWKSMPSRIGVRLWLHALRSSVLFDTKEVLSALMEMSEADFWLIRRELALVLRDALVDAGPGAIEPLEQRIIVEAIKYYERYKVEDGQTDWRPNARDSEVWLRLKMLERAGVLSHNGQAELEAIGQRRENLDRDVTDRDFFHSYSFGIRSVTGDATPLLEASEDDRLKVAHDIVRSADIDLREGWGAYCRTDPTGAFATLASTPISIADVTLWNELIGSLAYSSERADPIRNELVVKLLGALEASEDSFLIEVVDRLVDLLWSAPRQQIDKADWWCGRLWGIVAARETTAFDPDQDLYGVTISSAAGRLTEIILSDINALRLENAAIPEETVSFLRQMAGHNGTAGLLVCAALAHDAAFLVSVDEICATEQLKPRMTGTTREAAALRAVFLQYANSTPAVTRVFHEHIINGTIESRASGYEAAAVASKILFPTLSIQRGATIDTWKLSTSDAARTLKLCASNIREGAAMCLGKWINERGSVVPDDLWRTVYGPLFRDVWPKERKFRSEALTQHLVAIVVGAGNDFPAALNQLRPYLLPFNGTNGRIHVISQSDSPEAFPAETLDLLWNICGPSSEGNFNDLAEIIDRLVAADPSIEIDRRLQWLDQKAVRYT